MWYFRIGAKIRGPFSEEQMQTLWRRGELSSLHQISIDQLSWRPASVLIDQWKPTKTPEPVAQQESVPIEQEDWYFASQNGEQIGPISKEDLLSRVIAGEISPKTKVFGPGCEEWTLASQLPFLGLTNRKKKRPSVPMILATVLGVVFVAAAGFSVYLAVDQMEANDDESTEVVDSNEERSFARGDSVAESKTSSKSSSSARLKASGGSSSRIKSITDEQSIKGAICRVQVLQRYFFENGSIVEIPESHGTGFCVTPDGFFLTNRHVVESYIPDRKQDSLKIKGKQHPVFTDSPIVIFVEGIRFDTKVIHISSRYDLAVLKTTRNNLFPYFALSTSDSPPPLQEIYALGFPGVAARPSEFEAAGIEAKFKSAFEKALNEKCRVPVESQLSEASYDHSSVPGAITKAGRETDQLFVYHSANIFGGNSGGPLINKAGLVLGINTEIRRDVDVKEVTLSDGSKGVVAINDGNLNRAYMTSQFQRELAQFIPEPLVWSE